MLLFLLVRKVHDAHRKRDFSFQELGQAYSNCLLIKFNRSVSYWAIYSAPQVNRIKVKILGRSDCGKERVKFLISVVRPLFRFRLAHCFDINVQCIEVRSACDTHLPLCVGLSLPAERALSIKRNVNHVECLDVFRRESSGSGRHERSKDSVLHSRFRLPSLNPFLSLDCKDRSGKDGNDCEPFAKTNRRFFCCHILSIIAKRKIIA